MAWDATQAASHELHMRLVKARDLKQVIMMGTMDPQCVVRCRTQELKSVVFRSGGRTPDMNWKVAMNVGPGDSATVSFHHPGAFNVTHIGSLSVPIQPLLHGRLVDDWYKLKTEDGKPAGEVNLRILVKPRDGAGGAGDADEDAGLEAPVDELPAIPIGTRKIARSAAGDGVPVPAPAAPQPHPVDLPSPKPQGKAAGAGDAPPAAPTSAPPAGAAGAVAVPLGPTPVAVPPYQQQQQQSSGGPPAGQQYPGTASGRFEAPPAGGPPGYAAPAGGPPAQPQYPAAASGQLPAGGPPGYAAPPGYPPAAGGPPGYPPAAGGPPGYPDMSGAPPGYPAPPPGYGPDPTAYGGAPPGYGSAPPSYGGGPPAYGGDYGYGAPGAPPPGAYYAPPDAAAAYGGGGGYPQQQQPPPPYGAPPPYYPTAAPGFAPPAGAGAGTYGGEPSYNGAYTY